MANDFGKRLLGGLFSGDRSNDLSVNGGGGRASLGSEISADTGISDGYGLTEAEFLAGQAACAAIRSLFPGFAQNANTVLRDETQTIDKLETAGWSLHTSDCPEIILNNIFYIRRLMYNKNHLHSGKNQINGTKADFLADKNRESILSLALIPPIDRSSIYAHPKLDDCYICTFVAETKYGTNIVYSLHLNGKFRKLLDHFLTEEIFKPFVKKLTSTKNDTMWQIEGGNAKLGRDGTDYSFDGVVFSDYYVKKRKYDDFEISPIYVSAYISDSLY